MQHGQCWVVVVSPGPPTVAFQPADLYTSAEGEARASALCTLAGMERFSTPPDEEKLAELEALRDFLQASALIYARATHSA
jgi:hypothetical protein